ncbi:hypothetical protein CC1G_12245 [Coprinopsis cinerea okayama7|uniref:Other/FunK1 protein kinase n=1 Tax=Coprinopsis cinerea (strain Okayama-7 / 130 / ATCC MYA-4618 / FGSC 9003) TaxID=240176 RepID=A8P758_COPC7|nr:hypothetical protein CC1G_12245 [Coprinopsis cinerea okayama7\|eukprot:XP_001839297.2 hypothetical protein CC1G_12245 [Coprinopsis cinerea okayama7\
MNKGVKLQTTNVTPTREGILNAQLPPDERFVVDYSTVYRNAPSVIQLIEEDLESALYVQFKEMLTAFLRMMRTDTPKFDASKDFNAFLDESVRMKCSTEKDFCPHLASALNNILKYGRGKVIGTLKHVPGDDESIMVVNDPGILECESKSLSECTDYYKWKGKPDLIHMTIQALGRIVGRRDEPFDVWFAQLAKSHRTSPNGLEGKKAHWRDPLDCWEIKRGGDVMSDDKLARLTDKEYQFTVNCADERTFDRASVPATKPTARPTAPPPSSSRESSRSQTSVKSSGGVKRSRTEEQSGSAPKKPKVERETEPLPLHLKAETQAGFYGLELMRARWNRTYAIVILLEGNKLSLHWYDPQGCIRTHPIDIVSQLPLLVAMMLIFQRFDDRMRGNGKFQLNIEVDGETVPHTLDDNVHNHWMLKGRRSASGKLFPHGKKPISPPNSESGCLPSYELTNPQDYFRAIWQLIRCHFLLWQLGIAHGDISNTNLMLRQSGGGIQGCSKRLRLGRDHDARRSLPREGRH